MTTDTSTDVRWMSYDELAAALGIAPDSARRLVARKKWARRAGNDGRARIGVPADRIPDSPPVIPADTFPDDGPDVEDDNPPDDRNDVTLAVSILSQHIERLEEELEAVRNERDAERTRTAQLAVLEAKHETLTVLLDMERRRVEEVRQRVEDLKVERDRWAIALETSQQQITDLTERAERLQQEDEQEAEKAAAKRAGWWPFRRAG